MSFYVPLADDGVNTVITSDDRQPFLVIASFEKYGKNQGRIKYIPSLVICHIRMFIGCFAFIFKCFITFTICHIVKQSIQAPGLLVKFWDKIAKN